MRNTGGGGNNNQVQPQPPQETAGPSGSAGQSGHERSQEGLHDSDPPEEEEP